MVRTAAGPDRRLLERAQPRRGLAGVPHACGRSGVGHDVDEATGEGGDARQVAEEVQRRALGGEDRRQPARHFAEGLAGLQRVTVGGRPRHGHATSTWRNVSVAHTRDRRARPRAGNERAPSPPASGGSSAEVRSPSGVRSSARARSTASTTANRGGSKDSVMCTAACTAASPATSRNRKCSSSRSGKSARVCAPRLSSRASAARQHRRRPTSRGCAAPSTPCRRPSAAMLAATDDRPRRCKRLGRGVAASRSTPASRGHRLLQSLTEGRTVCSSHDLTVDARLERSDRAGRPPMTPA